MKLTRNEKETMQRLAALHEKYPANDYGFNACSLGASKAACCRRRLEREGLVKITRYSEHHFRYMLADPARRQEWLQ